MGRKRTSKAEATRGLLIDAALKVIGRKGYAAATVDQIVEEAGVSKGVAYYHFKNKADMATSVLERGLLELTDGFDAIAADAGSAAEALTRFIELFAARVFENECFGRFFVTELWRNDRDWSDAMRQHEGRLMDILAGQISRGQQEGTIRPELDPEYVAVSMVGMVLTTSLFYTACDCDAGRLPLPAPTGDGLGKEQFVARTVDFFRHACAVKV
ncbi:MAG: TetR/AcrR family transcriptional regulator [Coriobacteriia bacterium]|nr:TetR/AcrR family transcriptional regulator [Coriobacteriia bacterium]